MSITRAESELLDKRDSLTIVEQTVIADTWDFLDAKMRVHGLKAAGDDRAARLEAAIIRYIIESKD